MEVDVLINFTLMFWTYLYVLFYCPFVALLPIQTFQPFMANGLNKQASLIMTL
jgi:hypothetical protein